MGASNACISCHQPRRGGPEATDGKYMQTSSHWGPHHGPQATMLEGIQGAEVVGTVSYPAAGTAEHTTGASCISCHMGETTDGTDGGHTFAPTANSCLTCHDSGAPESVDGLAVAMETLKGLLAQVEGQKIEEDENEEYQLVFEDDGTTPVMVTGIIIDNEPQLGSFDIDVAKAAWNYLFVLEDSSNGVHNPKYSMALIQNSIELID